MALRLLQEWTALDYGPNVIEEARENGGRIILRGILQKADTLNQNGRIYPRAILEREVTNYQKFIKERRAVGELDHPSTSVVELRNGSHLVTEARMEGDVVVGTIEILDKLPMGQILRGYIEHDVKLGISSRGVGSTQTEGGHQTVNDDFQLICWDMVAEPSTPDAFMMAEGQVILDEYGHVLGNPSADEFVRTYNKTERVCRIINDILRNG